MSESRRSFFATIPGLVTGLAGLLTAVVAALGLAVQQGWVGGGSEASDPDRASVGTGPGAGTADTGTGTEPAEASTPTFEVDPTSLSFGAVGSRDATVKVRNTGDVPLHVVAPTITGDDPDRFDVHQGTCDDEVDPGRTCELDVTFDPEPGSFNAVLVLEAEGGRAEEVPLEASAVL